MKLKGLLLSLFILIVAAGCGSQQPNRPVLTPVDDLSNKKVVMKSVIPFSKDAFVKEAIKQECIIQTQLANFTKEFSNKNGVNVVFDDEATKESSHYYLDMEIIDAISQGNAFIGHNKMTKVKGTLYKDGKELAVFRGLRKSGGGFGAGFKGSCSVLGRTVEALGSDISKWIKAPTNGAYLGD